MPAKRPHEPDPEYDNIPSEVQEKRAKLIEQDGQNQVKKKVEAIIKNEFQKEIDEKENEIDKINDMLRESSSILDRLRACIITKYYACPEQSTTQQSRSTPGIHPTVKKELGKAPPNKSVSAACPRPATEDSTDLSAPSTSSSRHSITSETPPPPIAKPTVLSPTRLPRGRVKYSVVIGNASRFIFPNQRKGNDQETHVWKVYVREGLGYEKIDVHVKRVRFFLHSSFEPNNIIDINCPPFELARRGWGDFPLRAQVYFQDPLNKPVDLIHHLKLDKTFSGNTMLGSETHYDIQLRAHRLPSLKVCNKTQATITSNQLPQSDQADSSSHSTTMASQNTSLISVNTSSNLSVVPSTSEVQNHGLVNGHPSLSKINSSLTNSKSDIVTTTQANSMMKDVRVIQINKMANSSVTPVTTEALNISTMKTKTNVIANKTKPPNGLATYIKCFDSEGCTLLLPSSALIGLKPNVKMQNANSLVQAQTGKNFQPIQVALTQTANLQKNITSKLNVPLYLMKVGPSQNIGPSQVLLVNASDVGQFKKDSLTTTTLIKNESLISKSVAKSPKNMYKTASPVKSPQKVLKEKRVLYSDQVQNEFNFVSCDNFPDLLKRLLKLYPLFEHDSSKSFPFCAPSLEDYQEWNIGKKRAAEWQRASKVRSVAMNIVKMPNSLVKPEDVWTKKQIMIHCRRFGYTPCSMDSLSQISCEENVRKNECSFTDANDLMSNIENEVNTQSEEMDVDVTGDSDKSDLTDFKFEKSTSKALGSSLCLPYSSPAARCVYEAACQVDVKIQPVELERSIMSPAVEEMILAACREFAEDIIRSAVDKSCNRFGRTVYGNEVSVTDVFCGILENKKLEFLTNRHMGVLTENFESS